MNGPHKHDRPDVVPDTHRDPSATALAEARAREHFGLWLDAELERLVARFGHWATPRSLARARGRELPPGR